MSNRRAELEAIAPAIVACLEDSVVAVGSVRESAAIELDELVTKLATAERELGEARTYFGHAVEVLHRTLGALNLADGNHWAFDPNNPEPVADKARIVCARLATAERERDAMESALRAHDAQAKEPSDD